MLDLIPWGTVIDGGGWVVAFAVLLKVAQMVYTGKLVPGATVEKERAANAAALAAERQTNDEYRATILEFLPAVRLAAHSLQEIRSDRKDGETE